MSALPVDVGFNVVEPLSVGKLVRAKFFDGALFFGVKQRPMRAQTVGHGRVDEVAGVGGGHLEEDAVVELAHGGAFQGAFYSNGRVGPEDGVDTYGGAF